ncbi:two-component system response regulator AgrA [Streptococcus rupicaprae]|uniref:Two-component system response regulator AgrA n=1 Tax=Streptococcus rupicaprae TaxID=759619 RepID=A0ABV2FIK8_9STRE
MNVYILEDEIYHQNRLQEVLQEIARHFGIQLEVKLVTGKPDELLQGITTFGKNQIYFLDIELKGQEKKGLEVARQIREKDDEAIIIFVTTHTEFAAITYFYQVSALGFVNKELETKAFTQDIANYVQAIMKRQAFLQEDIFEIKTQTRHVRVPFEDICLIETTEIPHKLVLITDKQRLEFYDSIKNIEQKEPRLFRAHKAFLVNPNKVKEIDPANNALYFANGLDCLVSRRKIKELKRRMGLKA